MIRLYNIIMIERDALTRLAIQHLNLKSGRPITEHTHNIFVHCPFHTDKTPSMSISIEKGIYRCFSCSRGGSIEGLFKDITGKNLYNTLGIKYDDFIAFPSKILPKPQESNFEDYMDDIQIRFNPSQFVNYKFVPAAVSFLRKRSIPFSVADSMGMMCVSKARINETLYEKRLIIPIKEKNKIVSIEGRDLTGKSLVDKSYRKCIYPRKSSVNTLYQVYDLDWEKPIYAVEGLMDLAILRKYPELQNSTTVFGAGITERQLFFIKQMKQFIYIPDNDKAGNDTLDFFRKKKLSNVYYLKVPESFEGRPTKDLGDFEVASHGGVGALIKRKWLSYARPLN